MQSVSDFLAIRGLGFNQEKTYIAHIGVGFTFLLWHFQEKKGVLTVEPTDGSIKKIECELENLILNFKVAQQTGRVSTGSKLQQISSRLSLAHIPHRFALRIKNLKRHGN